MKFFLVSFLANCLLLLEKWFNNNKKSMIKKLIFGEFMLVLKNKLYIISYVGIEEQTLHYLY